ncbi:MAG: hypothetical protein JWR53_1683 [Glaciihabitans sp.]|jgi:hypothetical protein|nr:hypothetical protein [Glaciihabitans sp.]MDQ1555242.1 hypothetical protein [Actinomycetota bacterium]
MITISWLFIITVLAAALGLYDAITRLRGRRGASALAVAELIAAGLMLVSIFFPHVPLGTQLLSLILEIILLILLFVRGTGRRGVSTITIIALILNAIVVLTAYNIINFPALGK